MIAWFIIEATSDEDMTELVESTTVQIYQDEGGAFVFGDDAAPFVEVSQQDAYGDLHKIEAANYEPWYISRRQDGIALVSVWFESGYIVEIDRGWEGVPCIEEVVRKTPRTGVYFWFWPAQKSYTYIRVPE
ncbi:MAG: hypothetical protein LBQ02_03620 [Candidatus Nomurabacteria bacterium]|nr:hypothetical protein [Candidatus Nomurabacteria bacterium]